MKGSLQKRGKYWYLRIDIGTDPNTGKRLQKNINTKCTQKPEAEKVQARIINDLNNNEFVKDTRITFSEAIDTWMEVHVKQNCAKTTIDGYEMIIEKHIKPYFKDIKLQELQPIHIQNYYTFLIKDGKRQGKGGLSPNTVRRHHVLINQVLKYALKMQMVTRNVADAVILPKRNKYKPRVYNKNELKKLFEIVQGEIIEAPIVLASTLGLRRGEVLGLKWEHVDFENRAVYIRNTRTRISKGEIEKDTKTESGIRTLPMPNITYQYLKKLKQEQNKMKLICGKGYVDDGYVCCYPHGEKLKVDYVSQKFQNIIDSHGLPSIRFHDLRHSNATILIANTKKDSVEMKWISEWLGHSNISTTMDIYSHVTHEMKEELASKIDNVFDF